MKEPKITVQLFNEDVELSVSDAKNLYRQLCSIFAQEATYSSNYHELFPKTDGPNSNLNLEDVFPGNPKKL